MRKVTVYLTDDLNAQLNQAAAVSGCRKSDLIREGIRLVLDQYRKQRPTIPILVSEGASFAEHVDQHLAGFGKRGSAEQPGSPIARPQRYSR